MGYELRNSKEWMDSTINALKQPMTGDRKVIRGAQGPLTKQTTLLKENGAAFKSGISASTNNLLRLLRTVELITPNEIESIVKGAILYWDTNIAKQLTGDFHTGTEVWVVYKEFCRQVNSE